MKENRNALIFGFAIIIAAMLIGNAYKSKYDNSGYISVTGLGKEDFTSDLIVWEGRFIAVNKDLKAAYENLNQEKQIILDYLTDKGVAKENIVFNAVATQEKNKNNYTKSGEYIGQEFEAFQLSQTVHIESNEVEKIEKISREITELLNQGVKFYSESPRYYYTKMADLKLEMISKATEDARARAENIAKFSKGSLGELSSANMGVFQITGQNSKENYSWGGTFNTSSKEKTATITMKLVYKTN